VAKGKLVGEIDVDQRHLNKGGIVHGGALFAFADDLGGTVAGLNVPEGFRTTTIESKSNIFHACPPGRLIGIAVPLHVGRRTMVVQTSIYRSDGSTRYHAVAVRQVLGQLVAHAEGGFSQPIVGLPCIRATGWLGRRGTDGSQTLCWREADSNYRFRITRPRFQDRLMSPPFSFPLAASARHWSIV
jgi:uncharacterized protein (TIGR00369 family)